MKCKREWDRLGIPPEQRPAISPCFLKIMPLLGLLAGLLIWVVDATINVTFIYPDASFTDALFKPDVTDLWMRSLVIVVMTGAGFFAQYLIRKQHTIELLLRKYQHHLEDLVEQRTIELEKIANIDALTGIYNRRKFTEALEIEWQRARRYQQPLSIVFCDIDFFKRINDQYGHQEGDHVLVEFAEFLRQRTRQSDTYARWGGEEFVLLLPHNSLDDAVQMAEKLRFAISTQSFTDKHEQLTASFGVAQLSDDEDTKSLVRRADEALYRAKEQGRNRVCVSE